MEVSGPKETLKGLSENIVLKIGHLIIQSLNGHQNPDSGLKSLLPKEDLQGSIKEMLSHLDKADFQIGEIKSELIELSSQIITHPRTTVEAALAGGTLLVKVLLLGAGNCDIFVQDFTFRVSQLRQREEKYFELVCLISGILNCGGPSARGVLGHNSFMSFLLDNILVTCSTPMAYSYQSFLALKTWSNRLRELSGDEVVQASSQLTTSCISVTLRNWENPLRGVPDLVEEVLNNLLDCCSKGNAKDYQDLISRLWNSNMENISWMSKAKYPPMVVLLPRIGITKVMEDFPDFGHNLSQSFTSNHLAAAGVTVYRLILKKIGLGMWEKQFLDPFVGALTSDVALIRTNAINHWVPSTIKTMKGSGTALISRLGDSRSDHAWVVKCLILKQERLLSVESLTIEQMKTLNEALVHSSPEVRISAFSVLCHQRKKGDAPCDTEMNMIRQFIDENLCVDSPSFRQAFLSDFTSLTLRCRNFCVANLRKNGAAVDCVVKQLDLLTKSLLENLFPGANYQRLITALEFLRVLSLCVFDYEPGGINKSSANSDPSALLRYARSSLGGLLEFYTDENLSRLLTCTLHFMVDVRKTAGELLTKFRPKRESTVETLQKAFTLACSPKYGLCESAAILFRLCQNWVKDGEDSLIDILNLIQFGDEPQFALLSMAFKKALSTFDSTDNLPFLFLDIYDAFFGQLESNFLQLARYAPMHGILMALRACLPGYQITSEFVTRLNQTLTKTTRTMLLLLSGRRTDEDELINASFADMGVAIESLLRGEHMDDGDDVAEDENVSISDDHSLVLACTWLNLKESSLLASALVVNFGFLMSIEEIQASGNVIQMILTRCRQKGALESSSNALADFASCLLIDERLKPGASSIPKEMLTSVLDALEAERGVSLTRRSAGLPMFIRRIVASEPRTGGQNRQLLAMVIARLLTIVRRSEHPVEAAEIEDTSQAHALHILKSLVHDGGLNADIGLYLADILQACIESFNSPSWAIRNAALQLFGSLVPRLIGQKKVRSEDATHNVVPMQELFSRFPHLKDCLLTNLKGFAGNSVLINPGLVPLLSLLSRVSNGSGVGDNNPISTEFKEVFVQFLASQVINVRRLAAKAFANFTARFQMVSEIDRLCRLCIEPTSPTNLNHGILCCVQECLNLLLNERKDDFEANSEALKASVKIVSSGLHTNCYIVKLQIFLLCQSVELENINLEPETINNTRNHHPGLFEWNLANNQLQIDLDNEDEDFRIKSREEGFKLIAKLTDRKSRMDPYRAVYLINRFLQANLESPFLSGVMLESCNDFLSDRSYVINKDAETALDLLDVPTHARVVGGKLGLGARTSSLIVASSCFAGMLLQDDFKMFFEGGGPYVALFSEHCENLSQFSKPENLETSRLHVAQALIKLLPALNMRQVSKDLDLHVQYGVCQAVNAAFTLLSDEDTDVRQTVTEFVSQLKLQYEGNESFSLFSSYTSLSTGLAIQKLFLFGLSELSECVDWLSPIVELFFTPWNDKDALEGVSHRKNRQILFETGEGLNVYEELVASNAFYYHTFTRWARHLMSKSSPRKLPFKLNLNLDVGLESMEKFVEHSKSQSGPFSDLRTPLGYLMAIRNYHFLQLVENFPEVLYENTSSHSKEKLAEMISQIRPHLYFTF